MLKNFFCTLMFLFFVVAAVAASPDKLQDELNKNRFLTERVIELSQLRLEKKLLSKELCALEEAERGFRKVRALMFFSNPGRSNQERVLRLERFDCNLNEISVELAELRGELQRNESVQEALLGPIQESTKSGIKNSGWLRESLEEERSQAIGAGLLIGAGLTTGFKRAQPLGVAAVGTGIYLFFKPVKYGWLEKKNQLYFNVIYGAGGVLVGWFFEDIFWHLMK